MLTSGETETLQSKMDEWQDIYKEVPTNFEIYAGIFVGIILIIFAYVLGTRSKRREGEKENI